MKELNQALEKISADFRCLSLYRSLTFCNLEKNIPKDAESQLMTLAKAQGTLAADTFKSKVKATVKKAITADKRVSIPLPAAYCLFIVFFFLAAFLGLVIAANIFLFHSMELWKLIGFSVGGMVIMCATILYAGHQR